MFEIEIIFTDNFGTESATFIGESILDTLNGFVGVEYEVADEMESRWFNKDYVKEISSRRIYND